LLDEVDSENTYGKNAVLFFQDKKGDGWQIIRRGNITKTFVDGFETYEEGESMKEVLTSVKDKLGDNSDIEKKQQPISAMNYMTNKTYQSKKVEKIYRAERDIDEQSLSELKQSLQMIIPGPSGKVPTTNYASQPVGMKPPMQVKPDKKTIKGEVKNDKETRISVLNSDDS
jgi:hypothetical protein